MRSRGFVTVPARSDGTTTTSWFESRSTRRAASMRPAAAARSICSTSALMNTSTGAPSMIWDASICDPATFSRMRTPCSCSYRSATAPIASDRLAAAETSSVGGSASP